MTILFVGTVSGANVYFYAEYGVSFPYTTLAHATLFGLITVGGIMIMKAIFDLVLNEKIEMNLLDRRIKGFWERRAREEQHKAKLRESLGEYSKEYNVPQNQLMPTYESEGVGNEFLAAIQR